MKTTFNVMALSGFKRSGKDTTFNIISESISTQKIELAANLKKTCEVVFKLEPGIFDNNEIKEKEVISVMIDLNDIQNIVSVFGLKEMLDLNVETISTLSKKAFLKVENTLIKTPRKLAQLVGTEVLRTFHPDIHLISASKCLSEDKLNIVTDCRFLNEAAYFRDNFGAEVVFIQNNYTEAQASEARKLGTLHISEEEMFHIKKKATHIIDNNGTLEDLRGNVYTLLSFKKAAA